MVDSVVKGSVLINDTFPEGRTAMADRHDQTEKQDRLREAGTLNRTPEKGRRPDVRGGRLL